MDWSYVLCGRGLLHILQSVLLSVSCMHRNLDHEGVDFDFKLDHFVGPFEFDIDIHNYVQSSVGIHLEIDWPTCKPRVWICLSQGFLSRAIQRAASCVCV